MTLPRAISGLVLAACLLGIALLCHGCDADHRYPPDETCHHGERVFHHEAECSPDTIGHLACPALDCIADAALAQAPDRDAMTAILVATTVDVYGAPVKCGGIAAHGCAEGDELRLETPSAGADEQGHRVWALLAGGDGEWRCRTTDGGGDRTCYVQDFEDFVGPCRGAHYP